MNVMRLRPMAFASLIIARLCHYAEEYSYELARLKREMKRQQG